MTPRDLALAYIRAFCDADPAGLAPLLAEDLRFAGPLARFGSRDEYLQALAADPPEKCDHAVLGVTAEGESVAVFWEYRKPGGPLTLAQRFTVRGERIAEILLVFDTGRGA